MSIVNALAEGNAFFQKKRFAAAADRYEAGLKLLQVSTGTEEQRLRSNLSAAYLLLGRSSDALEQAEKCAEIAPAWCKSHFRVASALQALQRWEEAASAFVSASTAADHPATAAQMTAQQQICLHWLGLQSSCAITALHAAVLLFMSDEEAARLHFFNWTMLLQELRLQTELQLQRRTPQAFSEAYSQLYAQQGDNNAVLRKYNRTAAELPGMYPWSGCKLAVTLVLLLAAEDTVAEKLRALAFMSRSSGAFEHLNAFRTVADVPKSSWRSVQTAVAAAVAAAKEQGSTTAVGISVADVAAYIKKASMGSPNFTHSCVLVIGSEQQDSQPAVVGARIYQAYGPNMFTLKVSILYRLVQQ
jgi:tetratricopeptide (TPR) repeat protein